MPANTWNDCTDRQLLLIMIHLAAPKLPKWDHVAVLMGDKFTANGVRQQYQKLRATSAAQFGALKDSTDGKPTATSTPRKRKAAHDIVTPSKSSNKRKAMSAFVDQHDDDDDEDVRSLYKNQAVKREKEEDH